MKPSGIGGQAVIEGIMMRNKDKYSVAVRKPDGEIEVTVKNCKMLSEKHKWMGYPIIRGIVSFIDSLVTGISTINYSASFYDDPEEQKKTKADEIGKSVFKDKFESVLMALTVIISVFLAVGLFMLLPYFVSRLVKNYVASKTLLNFIEGLVRVAIFILYLVAISFMKDIKRTFMYHGAEHKCINCIENGARLTTENVMNSSRYHKRCGTSFLFIVMFISIVFFIFIRVDNTALQIIIRILLVPVIAGVSYEFIRWAGKNDNGFVMVLSKPGMWLQKLTTREPDEDMVEVAIKAVEEVFDWQAFLDEYYAHSADKEADMLASEAKLAMNGELIHKAKSTRKIDAKEVAMAETLKAVESKAVANQDNKNSDKTEEVKAENAGTSDIVSESQVDKITDVADKAEDDVEKELSEALEEDVLEAIEKEEASVEQTENVETSKENSDDSEETEDADLEGFEIEEEYEMVKDNSDLSTSENMMENEQESEDTADNMTIEEVEAGFEIEELKEPQDEGISADDVPLFKQRDRR